MSVNGNKIIVREMFEALSDGELEKMASLFDDNLKWVVIGDPSLFPGAGVNNKEEQIAVLQNMQKMAPAGIRMKIIGMTAEDDRVAVETQSEAVLANGVTYNNQYHFLVEIKDYKVVLVKEYCDTLSAISAFKTFVDSDG